jgi:hypothetical protein
VSTRASRGESAAQQLLDAQVGYHLDRLSGDQLGATVSRLVDLLAVTGQHEIEELVDRETVKDIMARTLVTVPGSAAVGGIVELTTEVMYHGPPEAYQLGELVDRDRVEAILDELLALHPLLARALDRLTESPLVGTTASRFMGRVVAEALQANKAVADKVPGLGSLMSFGTSAASKVMGTADKQFEGLVGGVVGKGGTFAVRRLNHILIETIQDPTTREAVLQVWDLLSEEPVSGLSGHATREEISGVVDAVHDLAITTASNERAAQLGNAIVDGFFDRFGGYTPSELLDELDLSREDLATDVARLAPRVIDALRETGDLERVVRAQLEPFYTSTEVRALLE